MSRAWTRAEQEAESARWAAAMAETDAHRNKPTIQELIEASSLGTPEAKAARARVPVEHARAIVRRALAVDPSWEQCTACGKDYRYPHLCREHMLCGLCHPVVETPTETPTA